ncbi:ABC transporter substrate-binding protein [Litorilinea aerophila]|uniref:ABC transporter substrate-binding protein n=1 Tax=Litorilinea aerophila TaxID=1204385 RepID=A0A540VKY5_9CHLR|nr:ABC transporter substrate-binding protein [Litorilinea aerophila]MCC9075124.1 ABC transporter substrate-binding protein [Litorilinea aerophila]GIV78123.1 MAG: peptide ABC transporter substrate-binding protein [Litorilinea sp.]
MHWNASARTHLFPLLATLVLAALLAACGGPTAPPPAAPSANEPAPAQEASSSTESVATAPVDSGNEAPMLAEKVAAGELPPLEERLPETPLVVEPLEQPGKYGGIWDMAVTGQADANGASGYSIEPWVLYDETCTEWRPNLAESVEVSDDGTEFTFTIRKGHKWSDGEPFTTEDIMFWYEDIAMNPELSPAPPTIIMAGGEPAVFERIDDHTFKVKFAQPNGLFLLNLAYVWGGDIGKAPAHYLKQFHPNYADPDELQAKVDEAGLESWVQLIQDKMGIAINPDLPVLRAWKLTAAGPPWIFERNPYFYKIDPQGRQLPYIDQIRLQAVEDRQMVTLKAIAGELDYQSRNISLSDLPLFMQNREQGDYRVIKAMAEHPMGVTIFPNQNYVGDDEFIYSLITDIRFRKALNLAINREELNELVYLGENAPIEVAFPNLQDEPELFEVYRYDPEAANQLLDEIGLEKDSNGMRLRPDGEPIVLNVDVFSGQTFVDAVELIASYWEDIGIQVSPQEISYDLWWPRIFSFEYPFTAYVKDSIGGLARFTYLRSYAPVSNSTYWAPAWGTWYSSGGTEGVEPPADSPARKAQLLFDEAKVTVDSARQMEILEEIERLDLENVWEILTVGPGPNIKIVKNNFRNVPEVNYCVLHDSDAWAEQYYIDE